MEKRAGYDGGGFIESMKHVHRENVRPRQWEHTALAVSDDSATGAESLKAGCGMGEHLTLDGGCFSVYQHSG